jgi:hypothetical protein
MSENLTEMNVLCPEKTIPELGVIIRPLNAADTFELAPELGAIGAAIYQMAGKVKKPEASSQKPEEMLMGLDLVAELQNHRAAFKAVGVCLQRCINKPLASLPPEAALALVPEFISQNFTMRLPSWVAQFGRLNHLKASLSTGTSATPANS